MKKITVIFTGGTIAMRTGDDGLLIPAVTGDELLASIPVLRNFVHLSSTQFANIPSAQMSPELCLLLRAQIINILAEPDVAGVVVVHGTDTMEETAFFLDVSLSSEDLHGKPVVLTGAMRSADETDADGKSNLLTAVLVAVDEQARGRGVLITMAGEVHTARWVRKMDTSSTDAFMSTNAPHFSLGRFAVDSNDVSAYALSFTEPPSRTLPTLSIPNSLPHLPRVDIINMHSGADETLFNASLSAGARAIIINAVGAGSVNIALYEAICNAISQDVAVVVASRSPFGITAPIYGYVGGGRTLFDAGACFAHDLSAHKARIYAQLLWAQENATRLSVNAGFLSLRGYSGLS